MFPTPRASDLITVPACRICNGGSSQLDEEFAFWVSWYVGSHTSVTARLFEERAAGTGKHNRKIGERILRVARPVEVRSTGGLYLGDAVAIPWNSDPYLPIVHRTVRGLFYHHHGFALDPTRRIEANLCANPPVLEPALPLSVHEVGGGQFRYGYCTNDADPQSTIWILEFYQRLWAIAHTLDVAAQ